MSFTEITVYSHLNERVFAAFSNFNSFRLHHRWAGLAAFPVFMIVLGAINRATGSMLLFYLFCACGVALPALYLLFYTVSLNRQIAANGLRESRLAYTVTLSAEGVKVETEQESVIYRWDQVYRVYILPKATYVYITRARAFLLPHADLPAQCTPDELTALIGKHLAAIRLFDKRGHGAHRRTAYDV